VEAVAAAMKLDKMLVAHFNAELHYIACQGPSLSSLFPFSPSPLHSPLIFHFLILSPSSPRRGGLFASTLHRSIVECYDIVEIMNAFMVFNLVSLVIAVSTSSLDNLF